MVQGGDWYIISEVWLKKWRNFIENSALLLQTTIVAVDAVSLIMLCALHCYRRAV